MHDPGWRGQRVWRGLVKREDVDAFALESQKRAARAREGGFFAGSVVPVKDFLDQTILGEDEFETLTDITSAVKGNNRNRNESRVQADLTRLKYSRQ